MLTTVRAIYEADGVLRLLQPLPLRTGQEVAVTLEVPQAATDPAFGLSDLAVDGGPADLAHEHNFYLYGAPRQGLIHDS
jgi:predicted DNA-binding antitoxin AbrB/MazE fold protein